MTGTGMRVTEQQRAVLVALSGLPEDFRFSDFADLVNETKLTRPEVRRSCRALTRKGLAQFGRGLWTEDGEPAGSGYGITPLGRSVISGS